MNVEGEDADGHAGLGSGVIMAAYALQADMDDGRHSSVGTLFGGDSGSNALHDGGGAASAGPPRVVPRSHARSVPSVGSHHCHHAGGGHAPSPLGSVSQPASPTHTQKSKLSPGSHRTSQVHGASDAHTVTCAPAEAGVDDRQAVGRSQPSLTFAAPEPPAEHQQYQIFGGPPGSLQLPVGHAEPGQQQASPPVAEPPTLPPGEQQQQQQQASPSSAQPLTAAASKRSSTQGSGASALSRSLHQAPSFGFAPPPRASQQHPQVHWPRRDTTNPFLPRDSTAAQLAAAGAAAAEAARLHIAADELHRRITAALLAGEACEEEEVPDAHSSEEESASDGEDGAAEAGGGGKREGSLNPEASGAGEGTTDGDELGLEDIQAVREEKWYRSTAFWVRSVSLALSLAFFVTGILCLVVWPHVKLAGFNLWRWCFFLGCWPPIYWASVWAVWALTKFCQWRMFAARTAVYFLVGTRGALMLVLRSCLLLAAFAALFQTQPDVDSDAAVKKVFDTLLRLLGCLALASVANLVKKLLIKLMATHFHKEAHFQRMQEALRKEYFLSALSQPRERRDSTLDGGEGVGADGGPRPKSFAKRWMSRNFVSKGVAAMHMLPSRALRSFTARRRERSHSDPLLVAGARLSDAAAVSRGHTGGGGGSSEQEGEGGVGGSDEGRHAAGDKPNRSATTTLTGIRVVAGAGVEPTCRSMPNLGTLAKVLGGATAVQPQQQAQRLLARQAAQARQWPRQHTPRVSEAGGAAPRSLLRASLASRRPSVASSLRPAARQSTAVQAASRQGSLASLAGGPPPPLQQLLDLQTSPDQLRARNRRTSVVQMPPEELEKMHHIEKHIRKNQLKVTLVEQLGSLQKHSTAGDANEQEARRVAFFLYHNLRASRRRNWVQQSDLEHFLPTEQAAEAFLYLDADGNGRISAAEIKASVVKIFQERAHLALTLRDAKSVIAKLERLLGCLIHTLFIFFYLAIFNIDVTQAWLTFSSIVLAFTFIFGNSIRTVFECVVWLFVVHPYDVGDTLVLGGENHKVEEIALLNTVMLRWDGARIYAPNSRLNSEQLFNLSRSASKSEVLKISLDMDTPLEVVEMLRGTVEAHVKANAAEFSGASAVNVRAMGDPLKLVISVWYEYNHCGVDQGRCSRARTALYMVLAAALNAAHVQFTLPPFPGDSAASRAHTALEARPELAAAVGQPPAASLA